MVVTSASTSASVNFSPTKEELDLVAQIYDRAGIPSQGVIERNDAAKILTASILGDFSLGMLDDVWECADEEKSGYLSEDGIAIVLRLVGWAQSGQEVTNHLVNTPGPLPEFRKLTDHSYAASGSGSNPLTYTESDRDAFQEIFEELKPRYGLLEVFKARDVFIRHGLAPEAFWDIWLRSTKNRRISDTKKWGVLDRHEFALAMLHIRGLVSGQLVSIPLETPRELFDQIIAMPRKPQATQAPSDSPPPPKPPPKRQNKLQKPLEDLSATNHPPVQIKLPHLPATPSASHPATSAAITTEQWAVSPITKADADEYYDSLDFQKVGYVDGDIAARFMLRFKLKPDDLAHIWDLVDFNNDNRLTRDGFAIAVHLIQQKLHGGEIPHTLPPSLIPPSLRPKPSPDTALVRSASASSNASVKSRDRLRRHTTVIPSVPPKPAFSNQRSSRALSTSNNASSTLKSPNSGSSSITSSPVTSKPKVPNPRGADLQRQQDLERENRSLALKIEELSAQIDAHRDLQTENDKLTQEIKTLNTRMHDMEQVILELLQANETHSVLDDMTRENQLLTRRLADLEQVQVQLNDTSRRLDSSKQENRELSARLQQVRQSAEVAELRSQEEKSEERRKVEVLTQDNEDLRKRCRDMELSISQGPRPQNSASSVQELEILMGDVTRENEALKHRLRQIQRSTTHLMLSNSSDHAVSDDLRRDNQRLTMQVQELEQLARQLQNSSAGDSELQLVLQDMTDENDALKGSIRDMQLQIIQLQSGPSGQTGPLRREIIDLKAEVRRLQMQAQIQNMPSSPTPHDNSGPPPAYDD